MARRITNIGSIIEYINQLNGRRITNIGAVLEYIDQLNYKRITNIGATVEYRDTTILDMIRLNLTGSRSLNNGGRQ